MLYVICLTEMNFRTGTHPSMWLLIRIYAIGKKINVFFLARLKLFTCSNISVHVVIFLVEVYSRTKTGPLAGIHQPPRVLLLQHADKFPSCRNSETPRSSQVEGVGVGRLRCKSGIWNNVSRCVFLDIETLKDLFDNTPHSHGTWPRVRKKRICSWFLLVRCTYP